MGGASFDEEEPVMNYEQAMKEISVNELAQGGSCYKIAYNYFLIIIIRSNLFKNAREVDGEASSRERR